MNTKQTTPAKASESGSGLDWQKTPFSKLIRYVPSGTYFARIKVKGKLIRRSLRIKTLLVAKLRLADLEKLERKRADSLNAVFQGKNDLRKCFDGLQGTAGKQSGHQTQNHRAYEFRIKALLE
jgi:hypothetical protein